MTVYTRCAACGFLMVSVADEYSTHPLCDEPPDPQRDLEKAWLEHVRADEDDLADYLERIIDAPEPAPNLGAAAIAYAAKGWPVFPLVPGGKVPATTHGFKDATTDPEQITRWWKGTPAANIGLPTGVAFDVIDVDAPAGWRSFWAMQDSDSIADVHGIVSTAGAGLHLYILPTGQGNSAGILPGIDIRGLGGYVVAPPSIRADGMRYTWRSVPSPRLTAA